MIYILIAIFSIINIICCIKIKISRRIRTITLILTTFILVTILGLIWVAQQYNWFNIQNPQQSITEYTNITKIIPTIDRIEKGQVIYSKIYWWDSGPNEYDTGTTGNIDCQKANIVFDNLIHADITTAQSLTIIETQTNNIIWFTTDISYEYHFK